MKSHLVNENRYEGQWKDDMKHGEGKFYHYNKGQVYIGTWITDIAKCGTMEDFNRDTAMDATQYPLPEVLIILIIKVGYKLILIYHV